MIHLALTHHIDDDLRRIANPKSELPSVQSPSFGSVICFASVALTEKPAAITKGCS